MILLNHFKSHKSLIFTKNKINSIQLIGTKGASEVRGGSTGKQVDDSKVKIDNVKSNSESYHI